MACSLGRTEEGDTLLGPPGNTEDRVPPNWKPPGLLVANLNPGELFPILDEPNMAPGREEPGWLPTFDDWKRKGMDEPVAGRDDVPPMKPNRKGRLVAVTDGSSSSSDPLAGVAVTVGVKPSLVMVAD